MTVVNGSSTAVETNLLGIPISGGLGNDTFVGIDEAGNKVWRTPLGATYTVKPQAQRNPVQDQFLSNIAAGEYQGGLLGPDPTTQASQAKPPKVWDMAKGLLAAAVEGVTAPGRAAAGEPVTYGDAWNTALDWGVMGSVGKAPEGSLRIFAGRNAKTADMDALAKAEGMAKAGASRDEIWRDTGWFQGVDGQWKFEIDDSFARLGATLETDAGGIRLSGAAAGRTQELNPHMAAALGRTHAEVPGGFDHELLYAAYPDTGDIWFNNLTAGGGSEAYYRAGGVMGAG